MAEDTNVQIAIGASQNTGALEVAGRSVEDFKRSLDSVSASAAQVEKSTEAVDQGVDQLKQTIAGFVTGAALTQFFRESVEESEKEAEALRGVKFAVEAAGESWAKLKDSVEDYASAQQANTRFEDTVTYEVMGRMARVTGNLAQAIRATTLAEDIAVGAKMDLGRATELVANLIAGQERAVVMARKELGAFVGTATTAQQTLENLSKGFTGAADAEESWTKTTSQAKASVGDFMQRIGDGAIPVLKVLVGGLLQVVKWTEKVAESLAGAGAAAVTVINGYGAAAVNALTGHFGQAKMIAARTTGELKTIIEESAKGLADIDQRYSGERRKTSAETEDLIARESAQAQQEAAQKRKEISDKLADQFVQSSNDEFETRRIKLAQEIEEARAAGVERIAIKGDETEQIINLEQYRQARTNEILEDETKKRDEESRKFRQSEEKKKKDEDEIGKQRKAAFKSTLDALGSLQLSKNKEMVAVGRVAASAQTTIDTYAAAMAAYKALSGIPIIGPALGAAAAASITVAGIASVARINAVEMETGGVTDEKTGRGVFANVGEKGKREAILPLESARAMGMIADAITARMGGGGGGTVINLNVRADVPDWKHIMEALAEEAARGGPEIIRLARRLADQAELNAGRAS